MDGHRHPRVAVLLATYNGGKFVAEQIRSLTKNSVTFTLHWLDDHSTDDTRQRVSEEVASSGIELREWHQPVHLGIPGVFFSLLECVEADIYLFCDQDDIWQPGKIDATVESLIPHLNTPSLCFSEPLVFLDEEPDVLHPAFKFFSVERHEALRESRALTSCPTAGNTYGFTFPLRQVFMRHQNIARKHALLHDWWIYLIALASGTPRLLRSVPTTLYRCHQNSWTTGYVRRSGGMSINYVRWAWETHQTLRRHVSRQAAGFCLACETLPYGAKVDRLRTLAQAIAKIDRWQSPAAVLRLLRLRAMPVRRQNAAWIAATCLLSDAD